MSPKNKKTLNPPKSTPDVRRKKHVVNTDINAGKGKNINLIDLYKKCTTSQTPAEFKIIEAIPTSILIKLSIVNRIYHKKSVAPSVAPSSLLYVIPLP